MYRCWDRGTLQEDKWEELSYSGIRVASDAFSSSREIRDKITISPFPGSVYRDERKEDFQKLR